MIFALRELRANGANRVGAAEIGQAQIHQRHVGLMRAKQLDRMMPGRRFRADAHVGLERDHAGESEPHEIVIVDEHQPHAGVLMRRLRARARARRGSGMRTATTAPPSGRFSSVNVPPDLVDAFANPAQAEMAADLFEPGLGEAGAIVRHDQMHGVVGRTAARRRRAPRPSV